MKEISDYFKSPSTSKEQNIVEKRENKPATPTQRKPETIDQKIVYNMEKVIKSIKKKHKHRRKKSDVPENEINDISVILTNNLSIISPNVSLDAPPIALTLTNNNNETIRSQKDEKIEEKENISSKIMEEDCVIPNIVEEPVKNGKDKKVNAFQLMMSSMNRSIGTNSPGKDQIKSPELDDTEKAQKKVKAQRKLVLEQWADKKGATKRKLDDSAQEEYVNKQMTKRAKRLKKLVTNMGQTNGKNEDSDIEDLQSPVKKKLREKPKKRIIADDSDDSIDVPEYPREKDDFVEKLNSPIKKRDSLLGYFSKIDKKTSTPIGHNMSKEVTPSRKSKSPKSTPLLTTSTKIRSSKKQKDKTEEKSTRKSSIKKSSDKKKDSVKKKSPVKKNEDPEEDDDEKVEVFTIIDSPIKEGTTTRSKGKLSVEEKTPGKKKENTPVKNQEKTSVKKEEKTPVKLNNKTPIIIDEITPVKMEERTPIKKEEKTPVKKEEKTPVIKEEKTPVKKEEKTPVKKEEKTPIKREEISPVQKKSKTPFQNNEPETPITETSETPKIEEKRTGKRGRRKLAEKQTPVVENEEQPIDESVTLSGRPRRSCTAKIKSYDLLVSPEKAKTKHKKVTVTPLKIINLQSPKDVKVIRSPRIYDFDEERSMSPTLNTPKKRNIKLAPLFIRKPQIDPVVLKARQDFLMSGIPEKMRVELDKQRIFEETIINYSPIFPLISHVQQFSSRDEVECVYKKLPMPNLHDLMEFEIVIRPFSLGNFTKCNSKDVPKIVENLKVPKKLELSLNIPKIDNYRTIVLNLKEIFGKYPTNKCYKIFRKKFESSSSLPSIVEEKKIKKKRKSRRSSLDDSLEIIEVEPNVPMENGHSLFTEKYKHQNSDQVFLNHLAVEELKKFLQTWQDEKRSVNYDSDFESSNSSFSCSMACNYMVLVGPCGTGKTSSVYALANELNYNVLEINASSRRKGKIILQELHEATQSHRIRKSEAPAPDVFKKKTKRRRISSDSESGGSTNEVHKMSLILIEDADIVFDSDEGFVSAINQLIATSKRPIVLTTTDENCPHLSKYIANNSIAYPRINTNGASRYMALMSLAENVFLDHTELGKLYALNKKDFRKSINELQFFIQSGGDRNTENLVTISSKSVENSENSPQEMDLDDECSRDSIGTSEKPIQRHKDIFNFFVKNQNQEQVISSHVNFENLWCNMKKTLTKTETIDDLLSLYDNISMAAKIQECQVENDGLLTNLSEDISHELVERSFGGSVSEYDELIGNSKDERLTISSILEINTMPSRSTYTDYEPLLRHICRSERNKLTKERRGNRFYHYFRHYPNVSSFGIDTFDVYCDMFS